MALTPPDALPERTFPCMRALFAREHMAYSYVVSASTSSPTAVLPIKVGPQVLKGGKYLAWSMVKAYKGHHTTEW